MIYLFDESGMTGETFHDWDEVWEFLLQTMDEREFPAKLQVVNGKHVQIGKRRFVFIAEDAVDMSAKEMAVA